MDPTPNREHMQYMSIGCEIMCLNTSAKINIMWNAFLLLMTLRLETAVNCYYGRNMSSI